MEEIEFIKSNDSLDYNAIPRKFKMLFTFIKEVIEDVFSENSIYLYFKVVVLFITVVYIIKIFKALEL